MIGGKAFELYPEKDIPIGVFVGVGTDGEDKPLSGCVWGSEKSKEYVVAVSLY